MKREVKKEDIWIITILRNKMLPSVFLLIVL